MVFGLALAHGGVAQFAADLVGELHFLLGIGESSESSGTVDFGRTVLPVVPLGDK